MRRFLESLEGRTLCSASPASVDGGNLHVQGSKGADVITVGFAADGVSVFVMVSNAQGVSTQTLAAPKLKQAMIDGKGGDDIILVDETFRPFVPTKINGGSGDDVIISGSANDKLNGGKGNDIIFAGAGNDKLSGKQGDDMLFAGAGNDKLDGGKGANVLVGDAGADKIKSKSGADIISADALDKVKVSKAGATFVG